MITGGLHYRIDFGNYTGDGAVDRAIPHTLGVVPKLVIIYNSSGAWAIRFQFYGTDTIYYVDGGPTFATFGVAAMTTANFYVGDAAEFERSANFLGTDYRWVAFG